MSSAVDNYEKQVLSRIAFLKEQAAIARTLNIKKNILIGPGFSPDLEIITTLDSDVSYYARGYDMIEKEMELIQNRTEKNLFIEEMGELERLQKELNTNNDIEKLKDFFNDTPIANSDNFKAAKIVYLGTSYRTNHNPLKRMIVLFGVIGAMLGICFVILENALKKRQ